MVIRPKQEGRSLNRSERRTVCLPERATRKPLAAEERVNRDFERTMAWVQHMVKSMNSTGRMTVVLPHGALFRKGAEGKIRKALLEQVLSTREHLLDRRSLRLDYLGLVDRKPLSIFHH